MSHARRVADLLLYGVVLTVIACVFLLSISYLFTEALTLGKWLLFIGGSITFAAGAWKMRPPPAWKDETRLGVEDTRGEGRFQGIVDSLLPNTPPSSQRFSDGAKVLVAGILMLLASFLLERLFGVPG